MSWTPSCAYGPTSATCRACRTSPPSSACTPTARTDADTFAIAAAAVVVVVVVIVGLVFQLVFLLICVTDVLMEIRGDVAEKLEQDCVSSCCMSWQ